MKTGKVKDEIIGQHYDVAIVGAGPCGVTVAGLLGVYGIHTLLVDLEPEVVDIPRAVGICEEGSRILSAAGMLEDVQAGLLDIDTVEFADRDQNRVMFTDLCTPRNGHRLLRMFSQPNLERNMRKSLQLYDNIELYTETRLTKFHDSGDGVSLTLNHKGKTVKTTCLHLLACDGAKSEIRKTLNIGFQGKTYAQDWMILDIEKNPLINHTVTFNIDPERPSVTMPGPKGRRRWEFVVKEGEKAEDLFSRKNIELLLRPWGKLENMSVVRKAIYTFHARTAKKYQKGRVYLLGDAAHLTPPFAGQGMMAGLRDAYNLAWKLASVIQKKTDESILASYELERIPQSRQVINTAQMMGSLILPQTRFRATVRDGVIKLLGYMGLHSAEKGLPVSRVPNHINGYFWTNFYRHKLQGTGVEFPQYKVSNKYGKAQLIDQLLGDKYYILRWEASAENLLDEDTLAEWRLMGGHLLTLASSPTTREGRLIDETGAYADFFQQGNRVLVIRPDKMIVINCSPQKLEKKLKQYIRANALKAPQQGTTILERA